MSVFVCSFSLERVIILFITDTDEFLYGIMTVINQNWVKGLTHLPKKEMDMSEMENNDLKNKLKNVESELDELRDRMKQIQEVLQLKGEASATPQDGSALQRDESFKSCSSETFYGDQKGI